MKEFGNLVWEAFQSLVMKCISFKNIIFAVATYVGVRVVIRLDGSFREWAVYELVLLILFYTSNQFQKWIFARVLNKQSSGTTETNTTVTETYSTGRGGQADIPKED